MISAITSAMLCLSMAAGPIDKGEATQETMRWNVVAMGAVADGKTDNTAAFQKALDRAAQAGGGVVEVPAGRFRFDGTLSVPQGVTLQGTYRTAPTVGHKDIKPDGTMLLVYAGRGSQEGPPFIRLAGENAAIAGLVVNYPEWQATDVPPVPYPPCVASTNTRNVSIQDCCFLNPYEAIKFVRAHRHLVRNVTGYPSKRGIYIDACMDIGRIENVHFWPFGVRYKPDDPYCKWVNTQGVAFEFNRTDWQYVLNTFCFGYGVGYKFSESKAGSANGNFLGLGADSCRRAILVEQIQPYGLLITNGEFVGRWSSNDSVCVEIGPKVQGKVSLSNCAFWGPIDRCVWMRSAGGQFTATACHFESWDTGGLGEPAIQVDAGKTIIQGCTFTHDGLNAEIGAQVRSAILLGNQASGGLSITNHAGTRTQSVANEMPLEITGAARLNYRIDVGALGDGQFLEGWYLRERIGESTPVQTMRWSRPSSKLILPVAPNESYEVRIHMNVPPQAMSDAAGFYVGDRKVSDLKQGVSVTTVNIPAADADEVAIELRCEGWVPRDIMPKSNDTRVLGVSVLSIQVTARENSASGKIFNANTGNWEDE